MEDVGGIPCPVGGNLVADLVRVKVHLRAVHGIRTSLPYPNGYVCGLHGCEGRFFNTLRGWTIHTEQNHLAAAGGPVGDGQDLEQVAPEDDEQIGVVGEVAEHEGHGVNQDGGVAIQVVDEVFEGDGVGAVDSDFSGSDSDSEDSAAKKLAAIETLPNGKKDIKHAATNMIVDMRTVAAMTRVGVRRAMKAAELVIKINNDTLKDDVNSYLTSIGKENTQQGKDLLQKLDSPSPFKGMVSNEGQISAIKRYYSYKEAKLFYVGDRLDLRFAHDANYVQRPVPNTYGYICALEILKLIARKKEIMEYVKSRRPNQDGMLESFTDSDQFQRSPFFQEYPDAFQLCLSYDDIDAARIVGPKAGIHKLANFMLEILNLPPSLKVRLGAIRPLVLAYSSDCQNTFTDVLHRFVNVVRQLEEGARVWVNDEFVTLRGTLVAVKGDTEAVHKLLGFLAAGARHFCRQCMISRPQLHAGDVPFGERRTPDLTEMQLQQIAQNPNFATECGLRCNTCLHETNNFRAECNCNFDLQHDGPEGLIPMATRLCLKQLIIVEGLFTHVELNERILGFNYGKQNMKDRPNIQFSLESLQQANRVHNMKQNAAQVLVLMRALPFLLDNIGENGIPEENMYYQYLLLMSQIYEIASAPRIHRDVIPQLRRLLEIFRRSWYELFPDVPPINKFHHWQHIPENTLEKGPMRQYMCFRTESKNCPIKRHIATVNNFINPAKTALEQAQIYQAKMWGTNDELKDEITVSKREKVNIRGLPVAQLLQAIGFGADDTITTVKNASINGFEYSVGEFVMVAKERADPHRLPRFARIQSILCPDEDSVWFAVQSWCTDFYVERMNAYSVSLMDAYSPVHLFDFKDLPLHPPLSRWRDYSTARSYLCLKYAVF